MFFFTSDTDTVIVFLPWTLKVKPTKFTNTRITALWKICHSDLVLLNFHVYRVRVQWSYRILSWPAPSSHLGEPKWLASLMIKKLDKVSDWLIINTDSDRPTGILSCDMGNTDSEWSIRHLIISASALVNIYIIVYNTIFFQ